MSLITACGTLVGRKSMYLWISWITASVKGIWLRSDMRGLRSRPITESISFCIFSVEKSVNVGWTTFVCLNLSPYLQQNMLSAHQKYIIILSTNIGFLWRYPRLAHFHIAKAYFLSQGTIVTCGSDRNCPYWSHNLLKSFKLFISITYYLWVFMENQNCKSQCDACGPCSSKEQVKCCSAQSLNGEFWVIVPFLLQEDLAEGFEWQTQEVCLKRKILYP